MQYFSERASSHREALEKIRVKYGGQAIILTHRSVKIGGFMGMFAHEGVEVTGYISHEEPKKRNTNLEEEKKKILASVKNEQTLTQVLKEIQSIKERFETVPQQSRQEDHPTMRQIEDLLYRNEFSPAFTREILDQVKSGFSLDQLENVEEVQRQVVDWIGERILVTDQKRAGRPYIFVLVGPTGVGKTTTIAKLGAIYGLGTAGNKPMNVRMITIDTYRIAAKEQIETYGKIMGIPVTSVQSPQDLKKALDLYHDVDIILIDTIGKSPRDFTKMAEKCRRCWKHVPGRLKLISHSAQPRRPLMSTRFCSSSRLSGTTRSSLRSSMRRRGSETF